MENIKSISWAEAEKLILERAGDGITKYQIQFVDFMPSDWTIEVLLKEHRARTILDDASVKRVRLIFDGQTFEAKS